MKGQIDLWTVVANEFAAICRVDAARDIDYVTSRAGKEGFSFFTITLTEFGKAFELCLSKGGTPRSDSLRSPFAGFACSRSGIPQFLGGFLRLVFDMQSGALLEEPNVEAIRAIRQLSLMYGKILLPCTEARENAAFANYLECEQELATSDETRPVHLTEDFGKASLLLWGNAMQQVDEDIYYGRIIPRHGPGATADRLFANAKWRQAEWTDRLEEVFPFGEYLIPNVRYHFEHLAFVKFLEPGAERPVRVITVPKTLKTPRIIAIEPTCMQYVQQGISRSLVPLLESSPGRQGILGFTDQIPNQEMARIGSLSGDLSTFDLSEASDRVSNQLVTTMTRSFPNLQAGIDACRSRTADVQGKVVHLTKFASMGSALTFPIEAMVFSTIVFMAIARAKGTQLSAGLIKRYRRRVRVYGDDLIFPTEYATEVHALLEAFGFKVNMRKSFSEGNFRESCGKEYFRGHDVSITRVRREFPENLTDASEILSFVAFRNQSYWAGLWQTAKYCDDILVRVLRGLYPIVSSTSPVLGRESIAFQPSYDGWSEQLHLPLVRGWIPRVRTPKSELDGVGALMKCLLKLGADLDDYEIAMERARLGRMPTADVDHLVRSGRPLAVSIKRGWSPPSWGKGF